MKINTKVTVFLAVSLFLLALSLGAVSVYSLLKSQKDNLAVSKNELLETNRSLVHESADLFFRLFDKATAGDETLTPEKVDRIIGEIDPSYGRDIVIIDGNQRTVRAGFDQAPFIELLGQKQIDRFFEERLLLGRKDFYLDNYARFLSDKSGMVVPMAAYFRMYDELGVIVGYGTSMESTAVRIEYMKERNRGYFQGQLLFFVIVIALAASLSGVISIAFMRSSFIRPLKEIGGVLDRVGQGDLSVRIPFESKDELGDLAKAFNQMIQDLQRTTTSNASRLHLIQYAQNHSLNELLEETLNEVENLTGSCIGFYHFVEEDQQTMYLQQWSTRTKAQCCQAEGNGQHCPTSEAGVWTDAVRTRRPVIHNGYASLPLPHGHAALVREVVVPVLRGGKIVGVLGVANKPTDYTDKDVEAASVIGDLAWEMTERKRAEESLHRTNRELRAISDCTQTLLRATDEQALLDEICRIVCDEAGYRMAWVGYAEQNETRSVRPVAWAGVEEGYLATARITWADTPRGRGPTGTAIRSGSSACVQDFATDPQAAPWSGPALERGYRSNIALPLKGEDAVPFGALMIYSTESHAFTPNEVRLLEELAGDLAFGITTLRMRDRHNRAEAALRASEQKYRRIVDTADEGIWMVGPDTLTTSVNARMAHMLGYPAEAMFGRNVTDFMFEEDVPDHLQKMENRRQGLSEHYERRFRHKDGQTVWTLASATPIFDDAHRFQGAFAMFTDITERKQAEAELRQAKDAADAANRAKDQFLAVLSHELRTPLTPVLAMATALEAQPDLAPEVRADMEIIHRNVVLETKLIDDLLDFTRLARGKVALHFEVVDAHAALSAALQICQGAIQAKHLTVCMDLQAENHQVWADPARLHQVFWNLLQNAAKFTPEHGSIHLRSGNQDGRLQIQVQDTGIGIEPAMLPHIFDAFVQAEQTKARRFGGLGMGLTIAKSIVELHQGKLTASSEGINQGATFTVELAVLASVPEAAAPPPAPTPGLSQARRILLVEDNPDTLKILARLLKSWGHRVTTAESVATALAAAAKEQFDLLVSDIGLPDGSGLEIMRQMQEACGLRGVAVSGFGTENDLEQSRNAGFEQHLTKPVSFKSLQAAIHQLTSA